jgi:glycosyltransferase involved in cell wall biosynthesis
MRRRLKITYVLPGRGLSGGLRVVVTHANKLIRRGHEVAIVVLRRPFCCRPKAIVHRLAGRARRGLGWDRDHIDDFRGHVLESSGRFLERRVGDGDVVVATHWLTAGWVADLPVSKGRKFYFIQGYEGHYFDPAKVDETWRLPMHKITVSSWLQDIARERFGDPNATLIRNGIDRDLFHAPMRQMQRRPTVGFVYEPGYLKGSDLAREAIGLARGALPDLQVVSFGSGRPDSAFPLPEGVDYHHQPPQQGIRDLYARTDVWLLTSRSEGFGLPLLEAMACRCPVVATRCGGPTDLVEDGVNGYLVPLNDPRALADRIVSILSNPDTWNRMSIAAYEVSRRFDWDMSTDALESLFMTQQMASPIEVA